MSARSVRCIKLCRLCANNVEDASSNDDLFHKTNRIILQQIKELTGITFKDMPRQFLPRYFCSECKEKLPTAYDFRRKIIKTQAYFKSKDYKITIEAKEQTKELALLTAQLNKRKTNETFEEKPILNENDADTTAIAQYAETIIKDETTNSSMGFADNDEIPFSCLNGQFNKINNVNTLNKTSESAREFDAVFLPVKKTVKTLMEKSQPTESKNNDDDDADDNSEDDSDDESDKDALENCTTVSTKGDDYIIGIDLKKKYKKRQSPKIPTKIETLIDPRKNPLFCYLCNKTLKTTHAFKVHCRKLHKGEKIFKCDSCEETFLRIKSLVRHNRTHQGGKLFECRYCDMSFNAPTTRIHHERAKHTKDWPFLCPICGKSFITTTRGKEHMTVHTKERPYKCELCKTAYLQRNNFKKHRRSELHKNNEKKMKESSEIKPNETKNENKIDKTEKKINSYVNN